MKKIERALISVWDKTGIVEFATALHEMGVELLSTGGTAKTLRDAGLPVKDISEFTGFPEMLDGRVKTLHPKVHAGLLYVRGKKDHEETMKKHGLEPIDLVCVNLYPFEATIANPDVLLEEAIDMIDIGGPTMIRSAAKNMKDVTVIVDPADYDHVLAEMEEHQGRTSAELRFELGQKVFARVAEYNAAIATYLAGQMKEKTGPKPLVIGCTGGVRLRYGENPHQAAALYKTTASVEACIAHTDILHGKDMSYNNYVDGEAALEAVKELAGEPGVAIIKHTNPCGYATGKTLAEAFEAAWGGDPVSSFGSVIAVTMPVDLATAEMLKGRFVEALIAPEFDEDALDYLRSKSKSIRLLKLRNPLTNRMRGRIVKQIGGGWLVQDRDTELFSQWLTPTEQPFPEEKKPLAEFGMKCCKHVKSNAIVIVHEYQKGQFALLGMGAGQPNRVDAVRKLAITKAMENMDEMYRTNHYGQSPKEFASALLGGSVLVSDAFFPFPDSIQHAAEAGIRYIVQPGGSKRDEEVIATCDKYGIAMAFTGMRHFKH
ncbi:MAG: bifunctional phosphoribosylaminoimidazolecarboxamide formyltransferase/IMP cyclohydrolase [Planctomycetota bacterium]